jgi:hypothetical protein
MAGPARSTLTRLLPWAALAVMTVFFFVQVRALTRARRSEARALERERALRAAGTSQPARPPAASPPERDPAGTQAALKAARARLTTLGAERDGLQSRLERAEALRAAARARARALEADRDHWRKLADERAAELARARKAAHGPVADWLAAVSGSDEDAARRAVKAAGEASPPPVGALRALWQARPSPARADACARLLAAWPPGPETSALAGTLIAAGGPQVGARMRRLHAHLAEVGCMLAVLASPSLAVRRAALVWLDPETVKRSEADRARLADALAASLEADDPRLVGVAAEGLGRLREGGHEDELAALLTRKEPGLRLTAVWSLTRLLPASKALPLVRDALVALLGSGDDALRRRAVYVAGRLLRTSPAEADGAGRAQAERLAARLRALGRG